MKFDLDDFINEAGSNEYFSKVQIIDKREYLKSYINLNRYNWKFISLVPFKEMKGEWEAFNLITFLIIFINGIMLFIGSILISRTITNPIKKLIKSMRGIEKRKFKMVHIKTGNDEIGKLKEGYNIMIQEIQKLIQQTVEEQRIKRKAELNVLQAQVKPHFLYNTLDAMGYLALSGKSEELYESLEALGSYYRTSLSKGQEVITIKEEIDIVKSYLILQKLRYGKIFDVTYEIDESSYEYKIPKLVLQPLVENSIYHGIKPKGEVGVIKICVKTEDEQIVLSVEDDGVGMSEEALKSIKLDTIDSNSSSFGLKGTIKRLQLFYGITDIYNIESKKRYGTKIDIIIPMLRGVLNE
jgi:two-component system sensor histidine kinase YesM